MSTQDLAVPRPVPRAGTGRTADAVLAARQVRYELLAYRRTPRRVFFSAGLPLMFLVVFGALYGNAPVDGPGSRTYLSFFVPGILAYAVVMSTFTSIASAMTVLRDEGVLKRVRGTPVAPWVFVAGHVGAVLTVALGSTTVTLLIGWLVLGVDVPWHALPGLLAAVVVGASAATALGIGAVALIKDSDSGPMVINLLLLPLTFISGIWGPPVDDHTLATIAGLFPVRMIADALQHAYDPAVSGPAFAPQDLLWLAIWGLVGVRLAQRFLRSQAADG